MTAWAGSTAYALNDVRSPLTLATGGAVPITNSGLESGASGFNFGGNIALSTIFRYAGSNSIVVNGTGNLHIESTTAGAVTAGKTVIASCMYHQGSAAAGLNRGNVTLNWYNQAGTLISRSDGNVITSSDGGWKTSTVTAVAPAGAVTVKIGAYSFKISSNIHHFDQFSWNLAQVVVTGLLYKVVAAGTSAASEPTWPATVGQRVTDGTVTWEAILENSVTWEAYPLLVSGVTEPTWPTVPTQVVSDGTINWVCASQVVGDANCPQSKVVAMGASKIFAGAEDVTRFSATVAPLDWTTARDAGFLPTGLNQAGANSVSVLNLYRDNLVVFNANGFQMWQIDPDPEAMALLDQMQGIGSIYQEAAQEVADELFFMSAQGIRTIGLSATSSSLQSGDVGAPVDSLIVPAIEAAVAAGLTPRATYYTGAGQYWVTANVVSGKQLVFVYTQNQIGRMGSWSTYEFPYTIDGFATLANNLYIRGNNGTNDCIYVMDEDVITDDGAPVAGVVQWPWLDFGATGVTKMLEAIDIVGNGTAPTVSIGYDQTNPAAFTTPYQLTADTMTGMEIPIPIAAPTMSIILNYAAGGWELQQFNIRTRPMGIGR
jgi:hypothetical protein